MSGDHETRLDDLADKVMEVFLSEADPDNWSGAGKAPEELDKETRGARNWDAKNANQIGALAARVLDLRDRGRGVKAAPPGAGEAEDPERDIAKYEKKAREMIAAVSGAGGKA